LQSQHYRKIVYKKSLPLKNKKRRLIKQPDRQGNKITLTLKLDIDNGLQAWKTEHPAVTGGIFYCRDSGDFRVSASNQHFPTNRARRCNLSGN
jgi:hypothetical protein